MTWSDFYLVCFLVGLASSVVSVVTGATRLHVPHLHLHHVGGAHASGGHAGASGRTGVSVVNFSTVTAFLAWFGGAGYLLTHYYGVWRWLALGAAVLSGVAGAALVFAFIARFLVVGDESLDPADYEMVGVLGRVTSRIRTGGTGELVYSQAGTRRTTGARSEDGDAIERGCEVIVTRYERGIAYVRPWDSAVEIVNVAARANDPASGRGGPS
jgi:hypothetical protein